MLQAGKRLRKATGVMAGTGDRRKSSALPFLLPASRCRRMCCVMAGVSLARSPVAAACDAFCFFGGGWCFVDGEVLCVRVAGRLAVELETGRYRWAGLDVRNVKNQDLTPTRQVIAERLPEALVAQVAEWLPESRSSAPAFLPKSPVGIETQA